MSEATAAQTMGFQAEVKQLLKLMIHSLYSHKEIFLRELISNASDACDKLRFEALAKPELLEGGGELAIVIDVDDKAHTISITDNGVGMTRAEAIEHLGTIAKSGTAEFLSRLTGDQKKDAQLIGQFGVGFYSSFIVAERVEVFSRRAGEPASAGVHWESRGDGEFTVATRRKAGARHEDRAAPEGGRTRVRRRLSGALARSQILRPHRIRRAHAQIGPETQDVSETDDQSRAGPVDAAAHRSKGRGVQGVLPPRDSRLHRSDRLVAWQGRGQEGIHEPAVHSGARSVRPVASRGRRAA